MYNKITLIGNVGRDPEMRYVPSGAAVADFSIATNRTYESGGEKVQETEWFKVTAWNKLAETVNQYVTKGMLVYVEGSLKSSTFERTDGTQAFSMEVNAREIKFLSRASDGQSGGTGAGTVSRSAAPAAAPDSQEVDDLPW